MSSLLVVIIAAIIFIMGYIFYAKRIAKLWDIKSENETPAKKYYDGVDYVPAKHWLILFGHHFSSIAGAGPILGPVIAGMVWGWFPTVLWLVFGSVLLGGVHDFSALMASIRTGGKSIADVCETTMSKRAKMIFASFIWLTLVLVIAVFASAAAKTLSSTPQVVIPTFGLIFIAIFVGFLIYKMKVNLPFATVIGIGLLFALIFFGYRFPISIGPHAFEIWVFILLGYSYIASIMPVNILLQPRDYLAAFVLFIGLLAGYIGLFITHPVIHTPVFISFNSAKGSLWPMLFVIVACGAISGFHSLISGGTTSKQLADEKDAKRIGYGAMITESVLAVLALLSVTAGLYWKGNHPGLVYPELMKGGNWIKTFGTGYGEIVKPLFGVFGLLIGITMLKTFILTTLDSATRIARYIGEELFGEGLKLKFIANKYVSTAIIIGFALYLSLGAWQSIWPIFGASNQLVAALALFVATTLLVAKGKNSLYTLIPAIFMLVTTVTAIIIEIKLFLPKGKILLSVIGFVLLILTIVLLYDVVKVIIRRGTRQKVR
ncbi:MAG: carbon starvation protein A [Candidatus Cloacimonas sp. 4484_209]|nr:MAG: carbon starvation protein A [Candidatus Cloacimonas sp. 4484_209]